MIRHLPLFRTTNFLLILLVTLLIIYSESAQANGEIRIYAASSLSGALGEVATSYEAQRKVQIKAVYASSSTLARQIINGAPADIFISANQVWMESVENSGIVLEGSRKYLLSNQLSLISPTPSAKLLGELNLQSIKTALAGGRLAMGDPDHVPAGIYAKQAFKTAGLWREMKKRIVATSNVRAALAYVERGEVNLGIVYTSDTYGRMGVKEVARIPASFHQPIEYPVALLKGRASAVVLAFFEFLQSDDARAIFIQHGFSIP
jgi:molybdate transport system substrate-binding protein